MQLWLLFLLVFVILLWGIFSGKAVFRLLAGLISGVLALSGFAGAVGLIQVGQRAHWTSDGPGMLLIMLGIPVCGVIGLVFGLLALKAFFRESSPTISLESEQQGSNTARMDATTRNRVMAWIVGGLVVVIAAGGAVEHRAGKPSHDARIVALHNHQAGRLASIDASGVVKLWNVSGRGHRMTRGLRVGAPPTKLVVTPDERLAFVLTNHHMLAVFDLSRDASTAVHAVSHVPDFCFEGGDSVLAVQGQRIVRVGAANQHPPTPLEGIGAARVVACLADRGQIAYVDMAKTLHLFDERTGRDRFTVTLRTVPIRLTPSPEFRRLLATDRDGSLTLIDLTTHEVTPLSPHHRSHHTAFLDENQAVIGEVSSVLVDVTTKRSSPYFNLGQPVTALASLPALSTTSMAWDKQLYIAHGPSGAMAKTERLADPRF